MLFLNLIMLLIRFSYSLRPNKLIRVAMSSGNVDRKSRRREGLGKPKGSMHQSYVLQRHQLSGLPCGPNYTVLGIETSCDDTGVAIVSSNGTILSNVVYSQYEIHERFGGVVPSLAMESHKVNIDKAVSEALRLAGMSSVSEVDAIAVTRGPGLEICLRVGCRKGQALAAEFNKPFATVHHLEAHCLIARLAGAPITDKPAIKEEPNDQFRPKVEFPFLVLLASGGHTSLMVAHGVGDFRLIGGTLDDALGEALDKAARQLGMNLSGSGGAAVEAAARQGDPTSYKAFLRVPMRDKVNCDLSFAGLKSSFRQAVASARASAGLDVDSTNAPGGQMEPSPALVALPDHITADLCATLQDVAFTHVEERLSRALDFIEDSGVPVTALVVVGGVAANKELRRRLLALLRAREGEALPLVFPPIPLCTDNGVMAAWGGVEKFNLGVSDAVEGQEVQARWPLAAAIAPEELVFRRKIGRREREAAERKAYREQQQQNEDSVSSNKKVEDEIGG